MASIFLSYAHHNRDCARHLARVLEEAGHDVWWDRRLGGGGEFSAEIEAALDNADAVVVAWSKESVKSRWVRDEAAVGCEKNILMPVSIDGSLPPMGFRQFHTLDFIGWKGARGDERTADFLQALERRLQEKEGVEPTAARPMPKPAYRSFGARRLWIATGALILVAAIGIGLFIFLARGNAGGPPQKPTIALLPFTSPASDAELRQLASQTRESIAHTFSQSGVPIRLMDSAPRDDPKVDFLITADLSRSGEKIVATVRLDEAIQRITVFSDRFEATAEGLRDFPELIGAQMAGNLLWSAPLNILDRRNPIKPELMAELLRGADFDSPLESLEAYQNDKRVAAKEPDVAQAQVNIAFSTGFVLFQLPREERAGAVAEARRAADRALALQRDYGDTYATWCVLHSETRYSECEDRLRAGQRADPDAPFLNTFLSHLLRAVGRFDESGERAHLAHTRDVYVPTKIAWMLKTMEFVGEKDEAKELYKQGVRWWPGYTVMFFRNRVYGLVERGDFEALLLLEKEVGATEAKQAYQDSGAIVAALKSKSKAELRRACPDSDAYVLNVRCMLAFAQIGDQDGAYRIADKLYPRRLGRTPVETERIWLENPDSPAVQFATSPAAAPMRRDPRFMALAERTGLLAYWRSGRLPDFCRKQPEPVCAQLMRKK